MTTKSPVPHGKHFGLVGRRVAVSTGTFGPPLLLCAVHPTLGTAILIAEAVTILVVVYTALFGSGVISDRAFRLLRWIVDRPEPAAPPTDASDPGGRTPPKPKPEKPA